MRINWRRLVRAAAPVAAFLAAFGARAATPTQQQVLSDPAGQAGDRLGTAVAIDGDTAVVGAPAGTFGSSGGGGAKASASVFTRSGTTWTQQQRLTESLPFAGDLYGYSVGVSGDTALVGMVPFAAASGAADVYTRSGTVWTKQQRLSASDSAPFDGFGFGAALEGDTALVGSGDGAYVFTRSGTVWTQQQKLLPTDATAADSPGIVVALSGDTAALSAYDQSGRRGAVYVYVRSGTTWTQEQKLTAADAAASDVFGASLALDADTLVVGAIGRDSAKGAAYAFTRTTGTWTQRARLTAPDGVAFDYLGRSTAVRGGVVMVGTNDRNSHEGAAYVFLRRGNSWNPLTTITPGDGQATGDFADALALDGDTAVIGARSWNNVNSVSTGAAYVYTGLDAGPPPDDAYFLPTSVKAKVNTKDRTKSTVVVAGVLDTGPDDPALANAATLDLGGLHADIAAMTPKGKAFTFSGDGFTFTVTPSAAGSSAAKFALTFVGDFGQTVALDGPLNLHFHNVVLDADATVNLVAGAFKLGKVPGSLSTPRVFVAKAKATVKGPGKDALSMVVGYAGDGTTPPATQDFSLTFGDAFTATVPAASFVRGTKGDVAVGNFNGITKVTVDYPRGLITVVGKAMNLGPYFAGPNQIFVAVGLGTDERAVDLRMGLKGAALKY